MSKGMCARLRVRELARGWKDDPETLPILKQRATSDEAEAVRQAAVRELARGTGTISVEVAHEVLIRNWERLGGWLNEDREFLL